ncbi:MAG: hypothetical protein PVG39_04755 [Desulfobacteraceae bacterium]
MDTFCRLCGLRVNEGKFIGNVFMCNKCLDSIGLVEKCGVCNHQLHEVGVIFRGRLYHPNCLTYAEKVFVGSVLEEYPNIDEKILRKLASIHSAEWIVENLAYRKWVFIWTNTDGFPCVGHFKSKPNITEQIAKVVGIGGTPLAVVYNGKQIAGSDDIKVTTKVSFPKVK